VYFLQATGDQLIGESRSVLKFESIAPARPIPFGRTML